MTRIDEQYIFESADAGCAGRMMEKALAAIKPSYLRLRLQSKSHSGGGYDVIAFWDYNTHGEPQTGPRAAFDHDMLAVKSFAAGFKAGMGAR